MAIAGGLRWDEPVSTHFIPISILIWKWNCLGWPLLREMTGSKILLIFVDFSAAVDLVIHCIPMTTVSMMGSGGFEFGLAILLCWLASDGCTGGTYMLGLFLTVLLYSYLDTKW